MLDDATIASLAERLEEAERNRVTMTQLSVQHPEMTIAEAYAVQTAWRDIKLAQGHRLAGRKIGLTSRTLQKAQLVDEPDRGFYLESQLFTDGARIPMSRFIQPRIEAELAFTLAKPLSGPNVSLLDVLDATAWVQPALEIVDSRLDMRDPETGATRKIVDAIGDNAANAGMILGGRPVRATDVDLRWVGAVLFRNGDVEETGISAAVMNHPAAGIAWLANRLAEHGEHLEAGLPILAGAFTRPIFLAGGDTIQVDYGPLGQVACRFE